MQFKFGPLAKPEDNMDILRIRTFEKPVDIAN